VHRSAFIPSGAGGAASQDRGADPSGLIAMPGPSSEV
jgi:hypothetical protein